MRYRHGNYLFADGAVGVTADVKVRLQSPRDNPMILRRTMQLSGEIKASTQSALRNELNRMARSFLVDGFASGLLHDDGSPSHHYLDAAGSLSGVKVLRPPSFTSSEGAEYATYRSFSFTVQADYRLLDADELFDYRETITYQGNCGPRKQQIELDTGPPDEQIVSERTVQSIIQAGTAVGLYGYPKIPEPIYPRLLQNPEVQPSFTTPKPSGNDFLLWPVRWRYIMASDKPLSGKPERR